MDLEAILNNLITSGLELSDPDRLRRVKVLNITQLIFFMLAPLTGLFYFYIGAPLLFYTTISAGLLMIPGIIILRKTKNTLLVGNYTIMIMWIALFIISWNSGAITYDGVIKPAWLLNASLILLAIFLNGYLSGTIWTVATFLQIGLVIYFFRNEFLFNNLIPHEMTETYSMGTYMVAVLSIILFAFLFESEKSEAMDREQEKSHALRESKRYLDDIFDRSPLPSFIIDRSHRVIQWNRACQILAGIPAEDIIGKQVWKGFTLGDYGSIADIVIDDPDLITENLADSIISHTETGWFELDLFLPNLKGGKRALVTVAPILDNTGVVRGAIQTIQEVTAPPASDGLRPYCLDESFPKPVFKIDSQGRINFWNEACEKTLGFSSSEMIGNSPLAIVAKRYRALFKDTITKSFQGGHFPNIEFRYQTNDGKPIYVMARIFSLQTENEMDKECIIVNTDITDLRIKLKKLSHYASDSKEKLKKLSEEHDLLKKNIATFIRKKDDKTQ